jgi:tetratricopeptide (TPR) repeat protein
MKTQQEKANELIARGNDQRESGKLDLAIEAYQEAIRLVPAYGSLNLVLGDMLFERQRYEQAADAYQATLEHLPSHDQAWTGLGQCQLLLEAPEAALESFQHALEANPRNGEASYYAAMLYVLNGDRKKAASHLTTALQEKPTWEENARQDALLKDLFDESRSLSNFSAGKRWWQFWKKSGK